MRNTLLAITAVAALGSFSAAHAATELYTASLDSASETPPNRVMAYGQFSGALNTDTKVLTYNLSYENLSGPAAAAHIHSGPPGQAGPPVVPFTGDLSSPIVGKATLTDAQMADLKAGKWYVNVHTAANKGGEIRGQIKQVDTSVVYPKGFGPSQLPFQPNGNIPK